MFAACGKGWRGARDRATVVLLWRCGLRATEAAQQRVEDVRLGDDDQGGSLRVSVPKGFARGAPQRPLGIDPRSADVLRHWLVLREQVAGSATTGPLLLSRTGKALVLTRADGRVEARTQFRRLVRLLAKRANIGRRVHPHCLRATFARHLYDEGVGIREIQRALGHSQLNTTALYLASIGADEVVETTRAREW